MTVFLVLRKWLSQFFVNARHFRNCNLVPRVLSYPSLRSERKPGKEVAETLGRMGTSFGCSDFWDFLGYDWSMLFKATINQSYRIGFLKRGAELRCADPQSAYWIAFCGSRKLFGTV